MLKTAVNELERRRRALSREYLLNPAEDEAERRRQWAELALLDAAAARQAMPGALGALIGGFSASPVGMVAGAKSLEALGAPRNLRALGAVLGLGGGAVGGGLLGRLIARRLMGVSDEMAANELALVSELMPAMLAEMEKMDPRDIEAGSVGPTAKNLLQRARAARELARGS